MRHARSLKDFGFSIFELLIAMTIGLSVSLIVFQMFAQNERVFRDQSLILEMQQNARAVAAMLANEIRMVGQGVPVYAATYSGVASEATQAFLIGTDRDTIRFRAGIRNGRAIVTDSPPLDYAIGRSTTVRVDSPQGIAGLVGTGAGRHVYLTGPNLDSWTWIRAELTGISTGTQGFEVIPRQISSEGGAFAASPSVSLEEAVSYRLWNGTIQRGLMTDSTDLSAPAFTHSGVGDNFTRLRFRYYDDAGTPVDPATLDGRSVIRRVDFELETVTSRPLSNGLSEAFSVSMSIRPRNLEIP